MLQKPEIPDSWREDIYNRTLVDMDQDRHANSGRHFCGNALLIGGVRTFLCGTYEKGKVMNRNVGNIDRTIRIVLGVALLSLLALLQGDMRWLGLIGIVPLLTGLVGWCPAYGLFGFSFCGTPKQRLG